MAFQRVCGWDDLRQGEIAEFEVGGVDFLIIHTDSGEIRAVPASRPRQNHPLCEAELEGNTFTCDAHLWQFDVLTGKGIDPEDADLVLFPIKRENNHIYVDLEG